MSNLSESLNSNRFVVTCELNPPKGTELDPLYDKADSLKNLVTAFNLTDSAGSRMTMAPIAVAHHLIGRGIEPILQITGRDRNSLAIQSELLAASSLGITNVLCMSGDPPGTGDHPNAKAVFDLDSPGLLKAIATLKSGTDISGNELNGSPILHAGAVANPGSTNLDKEMQRMEEKIEAGAKFFQTQAVYDLSAFDRFMKSAQKFNVPILAGLIVLKSAKMALNLNANLPGVLVSDDIIHEMEQAENRKGKSVEISARIIRQVQNICNGVHIMAIGWESIVPHILESAGISSVK